MKEELLKRIDNEILKFEKCVDDDYFKVSRMYFVGKVSGLRLVKRIIREWE